MCFKIFSLLAFIFSSGIVMLSHADEVAEKNILNDSLKNTDQILNMGEASQKRVDDLATETDRLLKEYQSLLQKTEYQKTYNKELGILKEEQVAEIAHLKQQIKDIIITRQKLLPHLREMVETLHQFIKLDLPFKKQERLAAVKNLKSMIGTRSVPISEKYRRVMEMYQAENDYNYDLGVYREKVLHDGEEVSVQLLRVGRSHLYFQTMDGNTSAVWNKNTKQWNTLPDSYDLEIKQAMRIASKKSAPKLLELPYLTSISTARTEEAGDQ